MRITDLKTLIYESIEKVAKEDFGEKGWMRAVNVQQDERSINENPDTVYDQNRKHLAGYSDGTPAIAFFCLVSQQTGKHRWYIEDNRNHGSAYHGDIARSVTPEVPDPWQANDRYLRGRIWMEQKICSFYMNQNEFKEKEIQRVEELFKILKLKPEDFRFEFGNSARTEGLKPWIGKPTAPELSPEEQAKVDAINRKIAELQATLHLKVGDEKKKVEQEIERLEAMLGKIGGREKAKAAYRKAAAHKISPFEKGAGSVAQYRALMPAREVVDSIIQEILGDAVEEEKVQIYNKTMCPDLWDESKQLDPEVRKTLLQIAEEFYKDTELKPKIQDVYLLGSAANYNWTPASDLDVHIVIDTSEIASTPEYAEKFTRSLTGKWNLEHEIELKGHKVELYIQDVKEENAATAIYSLKNGQWVKEPTPEDVQVDSKQIQKKYTSWTNRITDAINKQNEAALKKILDGLREWRQAGLDKGGEFSTENITFKILRARGWLEKIKDFYNKFYDTKRTVKDGFDPTSQGPNPEAGMDQDNGSFYQKMNDKMREMEEGYGAGRVGDDKRLQKVKGGHILHWMIRSKDAGKTPKMPDAVKEIINESLKKAFQKRK